MDRLQRQADRLAAAGVGVVAKVPVGPGGISPLLLNWELYAFHSEVLTSRLSRVRSRDVIEAWVTDQLATLGPPPAYYVADDDQEWLCITTADPGWLARLFPDDHHETSVLSGDGTRCLVLGDFVGEPDYCAMAYSTVELHALRAERLRLDRLLEAPGLHRLPSPPARIPVLATTVFAGEPFTTLPAFASDDRRDAWIADAYARWREQPAPLDDDFMGHRGLYDFSFAGTAVLLSFQAYLERPSDLAVVWRRAGHDRFVLLDDDRRRALALSCTGAMFEARITALP